jgi:hypothetical protein
MTNSEPTSIRDPAPQSRAGSERTQEPASVADVDTVAAVIASAVERANERPFTVAIMGQTGVGKSSLLNALFDADLLTDPIRPCTKEPARVLHETGDGRALEFWDMPGLGESASADQGYLDGYRRKLLDADLCVWAIHIDTRSVENERRLLAELLDGLPTRQRRDLLSKFAFVLTKADLLADPPWLLGIEDGNKPKFVPQTDAILTAKSQFFEAELLVPLGSEFSAVTHNDQTELIIEPEVSYDEMESTVTFCGYLSPDRYRELRDRWPDHGALVDRLRRASEFVPCSSTFRFNLQVVLSQMLGRLDDQAYLRFRELLSVDELDWLPSVVSALERRNIIVLDNRGHRGRVFDLVDLALRSGVQWIQYGLKMIFS